MYGLIMKSDKTLKKPIKENLHSTTQANTLSKTMGILRDSLLLNPGRDEWRQRFCKTLELWSSDENALSIHQFCTEYGFTRRQLEDYRKQYPEIEQMMKEVKERIGHNRWMLAFMRKASETLFLKDIHHYHEEWRDINKYHADLRKEEDKTSGIQVVYIKDTPDTGQVKPRVAKAIEVQNDN